MTTTKSATSLRLATAHGYLLTTNHQTDVGLDAKILAKVEPHAEASLQLWCDRANAYPELVAALRFLSDASAKTLAHCPDMEWRTDAHRATTEARALLAKLGEGA